MLFFSCPGRSFRFSSFCIDFQFISVIWKPSDYIYHIGNHQELSKYNLSLNFVAGSYLLSIGVCLQPSLHDKPKAMVRARATIGDCK